MKHKKVSGSKVRHKEVGDNLRSCKKIITAQYKLMEAQILVLTTMKSKLTQAESRIAELTKENEAYKKLERERWSGFPSDGTRKFKFRRKKTCQ